MEMLIRYIVVFLITMGLQILFSVFFHFGMKQIHETYSEESANQVYLFLKYISFALVVGFFTLLLLWEFVGIYFLPWYHKLGIAIFFLYFWCYCRACMGMVAHFIHLLYFPKLAGGIEYDCLWGDFKIVKKQVIITHAFSLLHLDISNRL